jgi:hypothetical protein
MYYVLTGGEPVEVRNGKVYHWTQAGQKVAAPKLSVSEVENDGYALPAEKVPAAVRAYNAKCAQAARA